MGFARKYEPRPDGTCLCGCGRPLTGYRVAAVHQAACYRRLLEQVERRPVYQGSSSENARRVGRLLNEEAIGSGSLRSTMDDRFRTLYPLPPSSERLCLLVVPCPECGAPAEQDPPCSVYRAGVLVEVRAGAICCPACKQAADRARWRRVRRRA